MHTHQANLSWETTGVACLQVEGGRRPEFPQGGQVHRLCVVETPGHMSPWLSPWIFNKALEKEQVVRRKIQIPERAYFLFCSIVGGTHSTFTSRSVCVSKQKFSGSLGSYKPATMCHKAVTARETRAPTSCLHCKSLQDQRRQPANKLLAGGRLSIQNFSLPRLSNNKSFHLAS